MVEKKKEQESAEAISGLKIMSTYMAILIFWKVKFNEKCSKNGKFFSQMKYRWKKYANQLPYVTNVVLLIRNCKEFVILGIWVFSQNLF